MKNFQSQLAIMLLSIGGVVHAADPVITTKAADGKTIFQTVCAQCHGTAGEGKVELKSPSIAGMPSWYVTTQFANLREGRRGHDATDPQSFMMAAVAKALQPEQIKAVVAHVEKMPMQVPMGKDRAIANANAQDGMRLFQERCMECHRYNASGEMAFGSPPLIGRQSWYLEEQLKKFKSGKRGAIKNDVNGAKMVQITNFFVEDEQMLRDVVAYIMTLNPDPAASPEEQKRQIIEGSPFESAGR
ncbi:MAG: c-type cytochrome [Prosthecobacter sp.]|uniref:c-type cytochrome n=1 Tax=Prosthecobacter sp. TaxID=1965333 RepID=UPI0025CEB07A|nr:c-type cytochrome [Prosthecobacter sp.]MCF7784548.1 c-type cytochrome [Prosthecobacter sp.]